MDELNTSRGWDDRYQNKGFRASGTYQHSDAGNRQFYMVKERAIDSIITSIGSTFKGARILDAAGGTGYFIDFFLNRNADYVSLYDFSETAINMVSNKWKINQHVHASRVNLACPDGFPEHDFDLCFVMEAIFLLESDGDFFQAINNISNCISSEGTIIISDMFPENRKKINAYVTHRSKLEFEESLKFRGFNSFAYFPQTFLFNRLVFGFFQRFLEELGPLLYWLDSFLLNLGMRPTSESASDMKYLVAKK